ncbi:MAG: hypothetical protein CME62_02380 [Halobacteriovoraceae bacterium]|nr:hypothetical protein [Halobacteriovoraceae bacterium]|tara:strand:- start:24683 stop:25192 length:510 start_codon:yes stop_codon:yes gene_type:complete
MDAKKPIQNEEGQALIEFILFIPFLLYLYFSILSMGNAINGSINQQKLARSYFYYRAANNSTLPRPSRSGNEPTDNFSTFGMQIMGWANRFEGLAPVAPCYKFIFPVENAEGDECGEAYSETNTRFIRVQTVYGICGATYTKDDGGNLRHPGYTGPLSAIDRNACLLVN